MLRAYAYGMDCLGSLTPGELQMDPSLSSAGKTPEQLATQAEPLTSDKDINAAYSYWEGAPPSPGTPSSAAPPSVPEAPAGEVNTSFRMSNAAQGGGLSFAPAPGAAQGGGLSLMDQGAGAGGGGGTLSPGQLQMDPSLSSPSPGYAPSTSPTYAAPSAQPQQRPMYASNQPAPQAQPAPGGMAAAGGMGMPWLSAAGAGVSAISDQLQQMQAKKDAEAQAARDKKDVETKQRAAEVEAKRAADLAKIKPSPAAQKRLNSAQKNLAALQALAAKHNLATGRAGGAGGAGGQGQGGQGMPGGSSAKSAGMGLGAKVAIGAAFAGVAGFGLYKWRTR